MVPHQRNPFDPTPLQPDPKFSGLFDEIPLEKLILRDTAILSSFFLVVGALDGRCHLIPAVISCVIYREAQRHNKCVAENKLFERYFVEQTMKTSDRVAAASDRKGCADAEP